MTWNRNWRQSGPEEEGQEREKKDWKTEQVFQLRPASTTGLTDSLSVKSNVVYILYININLLDTTVKLSVFGEYL